MTSLPDWLVERAALDEVPPCNRDRIAQADQRELADRIAALHDANASELAAHPGGPAVAQIEAQIAAQTRQRAARRRRRLGLIGLATSAAAILVVVRFVDRGATSSDDRSVVIDRVPTTAPGEYVGIKGPTRLLAFRLVGDQVERLEKDALVRAGDLLQLRYNAGTDSYGVIASIDGAGAVTLHYPFSEDAPPQATAVPTETTTLPHAYALDDAPRFERFFFLTASEPIDVQRSLAALRSFASRADSATASIELPAGVRQWSLRLRKPGSSNPRSP